MDNRFKFMLMLLAMGALMAGLAGTQPAQAQTPSLPPDANCVACHESLYLLHDTGKYYCQCAVEMTCTCCHGGNAEAVTEDEAHTGMILNPAAYDATTCKACHPDDTAARLEKFAAYAGLSFHPQVPTYAPITPTVEPATETQPGALLWERLSEPWRLAGLGFVTISLLAVIVFGYFCWKTDCMSRNL
jgi:hypothetical protein